MGSRTQTLDMHRLRLYLLVVLPCGLVAVNVPNTANKDHDKRTTWGYTETNGPATWPTTYATCGGSSQSPIDIKTSTAKTTTVGQIQLTNYDTMFFGEVSNNGHTATLGYYNGSMPSISMGRLPAGESFQFLQFHWHWGSISTQGSEHTVNGREYPAELHLVHWNTKYGTVGEAVQYPDGLAVMGFFYEVSSTDNPKLDPIIAAIQATSTCTRQALTKHKKRKNRKPKNKSSKNSRALRAIVGCTQPLSVRLDDFLPAACLPDEYYYYMGSLTTPTCDEVVLWTVFSQSIPISEKQLNVLRTLVDSEGTTLNDNYRPPQPLNGRPVYKRSASGTATKDAGALAAATVGAGITGAIMGTIGTLAAVFGYFGLNQVTASQRSEDDHHRYFQHTRPHFAR